MVVGEFTQEAQLVIIGGGPGGYSAAFRAAELGIETVLVDPRESLGGVCLHEGCIPSKTLLAIAETIGQAERAPSFGVSFDEPRIDLDHVREWVTQTVARLSSGLTGIAKKSGVEHIRGKAVFEDSKHIAVHGGSVPRIKFRRAVIATGSSPLRHAAAIDDPRVMSPAEALTLPDIPRRLLVVGCNYMAVELASIYAALGSEVTLVDEGAAVVPDADPDLVRPLMSRLNETLKAIHLNTAVLSVREERGALKTELQSGAAPRHEPFDRVVFAIGQRANTDGLGLDRTGVEFDDDGFIEVNERLHTSDARILAVGDVTGPPLLADRALLQGRVAAEIVAGWNSAVDVRAVPVAVFTDPQLAWCGLTEARAKAERVAHEVRKIPWGASGRAVGMGRMDGLTKLILDPETHLVLGIGLVGPHAAEMIAEGALAIEMGAVADDLAATIHPHPTMSELVSDAARHASRQLPKARK